MPSSSILRPALSIPPVMLADCGRSIDVDPPIIATWSRQAIGECLSGVVSSNFASATYPAADTCIYIPFEIASGFLIRKVFWFNGTTATTDNADMGVYTEDGTRLVSVGTGTTITGASNLQEVDVTDTYLRPGRYWMGYVQHGVTATPVMASTPSAGILRCMGVAKQVSTWGLPSTMTPVAVTSALVPLVGISQRVLAA